MSQRAQISSREFGHALAHRNKEIERQFPNELRKRTKATLSLNEVHDSQSLQAECNETLDTPS
mgnify:CR=1 FL=1